MRKHAYLVYNPETAEEHEYKFVDQILIGRRKTKETDSTTRIRIVDPQVSSRHCVVRQASDGRFFIQDVSRNGTKVNGRRLVPNVEVEIQPGDRIKVARRHVLALYVDEAEAGISTLEETIEETVGLSVSETEVTIVVGDINGYTTLNQEYSAAHVHESVGNVFTALEHVVVEHEGAIKEYQGDAIFAFWEGDEDRPNQHVLLACKAVLALQKKVRELAGDPNCWTIRQFPLQMEWALTTGPVLITNMPTGLAMVGDIVNYAFRLEKLADDKTGSILTDETTQKHAAENFRFRDLGKARVKGRKDAERIFALDGPR